LESGVGLHVIILHQPGKSASESILYVGDNERCVKPENEKPRISRLAGVLIADAELQVWFGNRFNRVRAGLHQCDASVAIPGRASNGLEIDIDLEIRTLPVHVSASQSRTLPTFGREYPKQIGPRHPWLHRLHDLEGFGDPLNMLRIGIRLSSFCLGAHGTKRESQDEKQEYTCFHIRLLQFQVEQAPTSARLLRNRSPWR
jgi:hypothetical protein